MNGNLIAFLGVLAFGCVLLTYEHRQKTVAETCHEVRVEAWEAGALAVINYDRAAESLPPLKTWAEFEAYAKESRSRQIGLQNFFKEMDEDRARRQLARRTHPKITAVP